MVRVEAGLLMMHGRCVDSVLLKDPKVLGKAGLLMRNASSTAGYAANDVSTTSQLQKTE